MANKWHCSITTLICCSLLEIENRKIIENENIFYIWMVRLSSNDSVNAQRKIQKLKSESKASKEQIFLLLLLSFNHFFLINMSSFHHFF